MVMPGACPAGHSFPRQQFPFEMGIKVCIGDLSSISGHRGKYKLFKAVEVCAVILGGNPCRTQGRAELRSLHWITKLCHSGELCLLKSPIIWFPVAPGCFSLWAGKISVPRAVPYTNVN